MARRTSGRFVAVEGQISLFAMDDPSIYEEPAESQIDDVDAQQRLALDFGAQQESYVSQAGGDKAARKDDSEEEAHVGAEEPVQGREGTPVFLHGAERSGGAGQDGETEEYLKAVERNYLTRLAELQDSCMESCGATPEFAQLTMAECRYDDYIRRANSAQKMAEEIALNETVLTL